MVKNNSNNDNLDRKLLPLLDILAKASVGDFSSDPKVPRKEDSLTQVFVGVKVMLDVIREKLRDLHEENREIDRERRKLKILIDNLPMGVFIVDGKSGLPVMTNPKAEELLGKVDYSTGLGMYSKTYNTLRETGEKYPNDELPLYITLKKKIGVSKSDVVIVRPDKSKVTLKIVSVPVFNEDGEMISAIAVFDDVTKEHELEKMRKEFVSIVSHQLRSPLGSMRWNLEMIIGGDFGQIDSKIHDQLDELHKSIIQMVELINDLLDATKAEENKVYDIPESIEVKSLVREVLKEFLKERTEKHLKVKLVFPKANIKLTVDKLHFRQILENLISNAVKYNNKRGIVTVKLSQIDTYLTILVEDTGIGIPRSSFNKIFDKFYRAENAYSKETNGSGLGLFVAKKYLENWGGDITFTSTLGKGSQFEIKIPLKPKLNTKK